MSESSHGSPNSHFPLCVCAHAVSGAQLLYYLFPAGKLTRQDLDLKAPSAQPPQAARGRGRASTAAVQLKPHVRCLCHGFVRLCSCILSPAAKFSRECTCLQPTLLSLTSPLQGARFRNICWGNKYKVTVEIYIYIILLCKFFQFHYKKRLSI